MEHDIVKLIPDDATIEQQARRVIEQQMTQEAIATVSREILERVGAVQLPLNLRRRIEAELARHPELSWDAAVAGIVRAWR